MLENGLLTLQMSCLELDFPCWKILSVHPLVGVRCLPLLSHFEEMKGYCWLSVGGGENFEIRGRHNLGIWIDSIPSGEFRHC